MYRFYEFFAGGGMARAGLGAGWECLFANDIDPKKSRIYRYNWDGGRELRTCDVSALDPKDIPGIANLVWASFPCQDLSLAGSGAGLSGKRSGTFWPFWNLLLGLKDENRAPRVVVLENVCGVITSHDGRDFSAICGAFHAAGYRVGALVLDAALFVPQSRPRLFFVGVRSDGAFPEGLTENGPVAPWHSNSLQAAYEKLPLHIQQIWTWWTMPAPEKRKTKLADVVEENPVDSQWFSETRTGELLRMMSEVNRAKVMDAMLAGRRMVGTVYKRTRADASGCRLQRAEIRFDGVSGCLRTPAGGSSRQVIVVVDGRSIRARLISSRETARLMGLPESYQLPENYNEAYHLTGDGVVVPVVRYLAEHLLEPLVANAERKVTVAA